MVKPSSRRTLKFVSAVCLAGLLAACGRGPRIGPLVTADPNAPPTPTPFGPFGSVSVELPALAPLAGTPLVSLAGTWGDFPGPSEPSAIEIPPPMTPIPMPSDSINIILLGSDRRPGFYGSRTDTIMIVSLDSKAGTVRLLSLPRDLYVYIPGWTVNRINTADQHGGPELVALTLLYNLGIEAHHWVRVSFNGFITAVNLLDGIDIQVERSIEDECDERPVLFSAGLQHMNGYTALCYARVRKSSSDFERIKRQQQVLVAVFERVLTLDGLSKVPQLYEQFGELAETDMDLGDILPLVPLAATVAGDSSRIEHYSIDRTLVTSWRVPSSGAQVLLPNREEIQAYLLQAFAP